MIKMISLLAWLLEIFLSLLGLIGTAIAFLILIFLIQRIVTEIKASFKEGK